MKNDPRSEKSANCKAEKNYEALDRIKALKIFFPCIIAISSIAYITVRIILYLRNIHCMKSNTHLDVCGPKPHASFWKPYGTFVNLNVTDLS